MDQVSACRFFVLLLVASTQVIYGQHCGTYKRSMRPGAQEDDKTKTFVNCWGDKLESGQSDLVILMDLSGSMGWNGYNAQRDFVSGLLSQVRVAYNATRIVIGTFSTGHKIMINYIWDPSPKYHKCQFVKDYTKLSFDAGMTNLRGALSDASSVFQRLAKDNPSDHVRQTANKVIIVISDGYGNMYGDKVDWSRGSNVDDIMNTIKYGKQKIEVYSVALTSGSDQTTMRDKIATAPELYLFKPSFEQLATLAKNIRGDPYEKDFETFGVPNSDCLDQCDSKANCGCNLITGKYRCACIRGYYGTGEKKSSATCLPCPANTYGLREGLQKVSDCTQCPANAETTGPGSIEFAACKCKSGYSWDSSTQTCNPVKCPPLGNLVNGEIYNKAECSKSEFGVTCNFRCNTNYELSGSSTMTCGASQSWIPSQMPTCVQIVCPGPTKPLGNIYTIDCTAVNNIYKVGVICKYKCGDKYFRVSGDTERTCQANKQWTGSQIVCNEIKCPKIPIKDPITNNVTALAPSYDCLKNELKVGDECRFQCPNGYTFSGSALIICEKSSATSATGTWKNYNQNSPPVCKDTTPPDFTDNSKCTSGINIVKQTEPGKPYATVQLNLIGVSDNSKQAITVTSDPPDFEMGKSYHLNWTLGQGRDIVFTATDIAKNTRKCRFNIKVEDKEKPKVVSCPSKVIVKTSQLEVSVNWTEPVFSDNCGKYPECIVTRRSNIPNGEKFRNGNPLTVQYTATDPSFNQQTDCQFLVKVEPESCAVPEAPPHGALVKHGTVIVPYCQKGTYPGKNWPLQLLFFNCQNNVWQNPFGIKLADIGSCEAKNPHAGVSDQVLAYYIYDGDCKDTATQTIIKNKFKGLGLCAFPCKTEDIQVFCGATNIVLRRRRRRATETQISIKMTVKVTVDHATAIKDPNKAITDLKSEMETNVIKNTKTNIENAGDLSGKVKPELGRLVKVEGGGGSKVVCKDLGEIENKAEADVLKQCYGCPAGEFKNLTTGNCQTCPSGTSQPLLSQISCQKCPTGQETQGNDKASYTSCKTVCAPGQYSPNGLAPCSLCPAGTYSDVSMAKSCQTCPPGTLTIQEGAKSKYECGSKCQPGTYSDKGVEPCLPCPRGYYNPLEGQLQCTRCPGTQSTFGEGSSSAAHCSEINFCASNPCINGKNCINMKDNFFCECKDGYTGTTCEKEVNDCFIPPCLHGGKCIDEFRGYTCLCMPGSTGPNCGTLLGKCSQNPCSANGVCQDLPNNDFKCVCADGYTGQFCEGKLSPCQSSPCMNEGVCLDSGNGQFSCQCKVGYIGKTCNVKLDFCASKPCQNGGQCKDGANGFQCQCLAGYSGVHCEHRYDMCLHTPCKNGGQCTGLVNGVQCLCAPGFGGPRCETVLDGDYDMSFQTRLSSSFAYVKGRYDLTAFTVAFWMRTSDEENTGTPISYAVQYGGKVQDNALVIENYKNFDLTINNVTHSLNFETNDGEWHHVAVSWESSTGSWVAYKDGVQVSSSILQKGQTIRKGGLFVAGEEQDEVGGKFTPSESFFGDLSQLHVWKRVLTSNEIYDLASSCKHTQGDAVAWSDFNADRFGELYHTKPSLACDFYNSFREYQYLKKAKLPTAFDSSKISTQTAASAKACATVCSAANYRFKCRAFTFHAGRKECIFYGKSLLTQKDDPVRDENFDLYQLACVKSLGLADRRIQDNAMTASSVRGDAAASKGRLYNVPSKASPGSAFWSPTDSDTSSYIQIELGKTYRVTGIGTQGNPDPSILEWVTKYRIQYKSGSNWVDYNHPNAQGTDFVANVNGQSIVRNELFVETSGIRLFPKEKNGRVVLRMEIYGCPTTPQGVPEKKPDANQCSNSPCKNGGTCYDLYTRYACVCPFGFTGTNCETARPCGEPDIPLNGAIGSRSATSVTMKCNSHWQLSGSATQNCVGGKWTGTLPSCVDINECTKSICSHGCENLVGGYRCLCPKGYTVGSDGNTCLDINECAVNNGGCNDKCHNTNGDFTCACSQPGRKTWMKQSCVDIDECQANPGCAGGCENLLGSFKCTCDDGYSVGADKKSCVHVQCPTLPSVANGNFNLEQNVKATYTCNAGYKLTGAPIRHCLPSQKWSGENPTCVPVKCSALKGETTIINYQSNNYGATVSFSCQSPLSLFGPSSRTCQQSGKWSGTFPRCVKIVCPRLSSDKVINGKILGLSTLQGATVQIVCNKGYILREKDLEYRTCQANKEWEGGNNAVAHCDIVDCKQPSKGHANLQITVHGGTTYLKRATYSCSQTGGQFCLEGPQTRICGENGQWTGTNPTCIQNACCTPPVPSNSKLYWNNDYSYNQNAYILCDKGYISGGTAFRTCQSSGHWTGEPTTCTIADCGSPSPISNGIYFGSKTVYNSKVRYYCKPGYSISGSKEVVCQENKKWSGTTPVCQVSSAGCGGPIKQHSGTITFAGGKSVCHWLIQVSQGKKVNIDFSAFNLADGDKLEVVEVTGENEESYLPFVTFTANARPRPITTNTNAMRVMYIGGSSPGTGFTMNFKEATCGGMYTAPSGGIFTPNYPNLYPSNSDCYWTVHRPYDKLEALFKSFDLQETADDYLEIYEGPFQTSFLLLFRRYGKSQPDLIRDWASRWYWFHFKSDAAYNYKGFFIHYRVYVPREV